MDLVKYKVKAIHRDTGRQRTLEISAISNEACRKEAINNGLLEPIEIIAIPSDSPTEKQLLYAKDLKIKIPVDATKADLSALIDRKVNADSSDPRPELIEYANGREMIFSKYIGKKALYNLIFNSLSGLDKIAFFLFCIYRSISDDRYHNLDKHQYRNAFYELAEGLSSDDSFGKSMKRYAGTDIMFFGKIISDDGSEYSGGSQNTYAYKTGTKLLCERFNLKNKSVFHVANNNKPLYPQKKQAGCLVTTIFIMIIIALVLVFLSA